MERLEKRVRKLEEGVPGEPRVIRFGLVPAGAEGYNFTPEEEATLLADEEREIQEARRRGDSTVFSLWSKERARELGASPTANVTMLRFILKNPDGGIVASHEFRVNTGDPI